mgnify:CR=1 FL=1
MSNVLQFPPFATLPILCRSNTATRLGLRNIPPSAVVANLHTLAEKVILPLHEIYLENLNITSGYRSHDLNRAVGGSVHSQHITGHALDFTVSGKLPSVVVSELIELLPSFDQMICEFESWIHISYVSEKRNRKQVLKAIKQGKKTVFMPF